MAMLKGKYCKMVQKDWRFYFVERKKSNGESNAIIKVLLTQICI